MTQQDAREALADERLMGDLDDFLDRYADVCVSQGGSRTRIDALRERSIAHFTALRQPAAPGGLLSRAALIEVIMRETTDEVTSDGLRTGYAPNILVQGCKFVMRRDRQNATDGYENPEDAANKFAGLIADAVLASLPPALRRQPSAPGGAPRELVAARENLREAWAALAMIRETVETLAPSGAVIGAEYLDGPTFTHEADALVEGIIAIRSSPPPSDERAKVVEAAKQARTILAGPHYSGGASLMAMGDAYDVLDAALSTSTPPTECEDRH